MNIHQPLKPLTMTDFDAVRDLAKSTFGISIPAGKKALVSSRLETLVRRHGCDSYTQYIQFVSNRRHGAEFTEFIDTLTTNHSGFWREPEHFVFLRNTVFPVHRNRIRIWSSACATGEEPYTIAMCALDAAVQNCTVNGSDISSAALSAARRGEYEESKTTALPQGWASRFFTRSTEGNGRGICHVIPALRAIVSFASVNLLQPFSHVGQFDVIFCRNVMIYFDQATRDRLIESLVRQLQPGGYLLTGHSETLLRLPDSLKFVQPATYRRI